MLTNAVFDSIQEVDENTWVIGEAILLTRSSLPSVKSWSDGNGRFFTASQIELPLLESRPLSSQSVIQLIHSVGQGSAVWRVGEAYCKVKAVEYLANTTREHTTLQFVREKQPTTFEVPFVLHHAEHNGRYFLIQSRMEGERIAEAWWSMDEDTRDYCVDQVVSACKEQAAWKGDAICGADGLYLLDEFLTAPGKERDLSPEALLRNCQELHMDCSSFSFYHCDMGPENVFFKGTDKSIGIIDWESAGYVPEQWIRTKFRISMGLNFPGRDDDSMNDWRRSIQQRLGKEGFRDAAEAWTARR